MTQLQELLTEQLRRRIWWQAILLAVLDVAAVELWQYGWWWTVILLVVGALFVPAMIKVHVDEYAKKLLATRG